jgi:lipopolysaccharide export LptBFGC system permease protein LptF
MSRTLFLYVFKDLFRIFLLALLALAVIMSFGGLLRPLTRQGLEIAQVGQVLAYLLPAMTTYALPIAALFATTMVYGRLASDNEVTACRAGGISYWSMVTPAFLLGLIVSIVSLLLLCFIVPGWTLQVERIATSNAAKYVAFQIERNRQITIDDFTIFAQEAYLPPANPATPDTQTVVLVGPVAVTKGVVAAPQAGARPARSDAPVSALPPGTRVPDQFWLTRQATVYLKTRPDGQIELSARADGGTMFERNHRGNRGGIESATYGPEIIASRSGERPKFMDIRALKALVADRSQSQRLRDALAATITIEQGILYREEVRTALGTGTSFTFTTVDGDRYTVTRPKTVAVEAPRPRVPELLLATPEGGPPAVRVDYYRNGRLDTTATARQVRIRLDAQTDDKQVLVTLRLDDADLTAGDARTNRARWDRKFAVAMPADVDAASLKTPQSFLAGTGVAMNAPPVLRKTIAEVTNDVYAEIHSRVSFSVSCWILVCVGAALGLMLRTGNLLSAFAVSVVPALLCIALTATGTHVMEAVPDLVTPENNPINLGIAVIWSGNAAVLLIATGLLWRLQRQ